MMQYIIKRISLIEKLPYINIGTVSFYSLTNSNHCQCPAIVTVNIFFLIAITRDRESRITPFLQKGKLSIVCEMSACVWPFWRPCSLRACSLKTHCSEVRYWHRTYHMSPKPVCDVSLGGGGFSKDALRHRGSQHAHSSLLRVALLCHWLRDLPSPLCVSSPCFVLLQSAWHHTTCSRFVY